MKESSDNQVACYRRFHEVLNHESACTRRWIVEPRDYDSMLEAVSCFAALAKVRVLVEQEQAAFRKSLKLMRSND